MATTRSAKPTAPASSLRPLIDALVQSAFTVMAVLNEVAADADLSLSQLRVLAILRDRRAGVTALADHLGLEKSTMSGLVERAEKRGLLKRAPSASDGRAVELFLSPSGAKLAERLYAVVEGALEPMTGVLRAEERERLRGLLEKMLAPGARGTAR
jgi:DNA-binding MarR family transcriptional regulator